MSIITARCPNLTVEREVRYTVDESYLEKTMSKISGLAEGLYRVVVGAGPKFR